jgi:hypothetical chaperone protein
MDRVVGLDFGTTNSALAVWAPGDAEPRLMRYSHPAEPSATYRSILYFSPEDIERTARARPTTGPWAIEAWEEGDGAGRLMQSLKTWLPSRAFTDTRLGRHRYSLEDLIAALLLDMRAEAEATLGELGHRAVVGRPVHMTRPVDPALDALALERLRGALARAGFTEVTFEFEPVAAAFFYEQRLTEDELVLIADFGGGTSDFSLLRVGPGPRQRGHGPQDVLGTAGVPLAGNAFDSRVVQRLVAPQLGLGSEYKAPFSDKILPIPASIFRLRWHELSTLHSPQTLRDIEAYLPTALDPDRLRAFLHLVKMDLSYALYQAVEQTKIALSAQEATTFEFRDGPLQISAPVRRADFNRWIEPELTTISTCVDDLLQSLDIAPDAVDRVFMTGGSSLIPAVRAIFEARFGAEKLRGGQELTSVATGLALRAAQGR